MASSDVVRNLQGIKDSPTSLVCGLVIMFIQILVTMAGGHDQAPVWGWFEMLGLSREGILSGKFWQIFTYGFLHGGWLHVGLNALFVILIGSRIERMVGNATMLKALAGGIIGGGLIHFIATLNYENAPLLVGSSGGCMALLLLMTTLSPDSRMMPLPVSGKSLGLGILSAALIFTLIHPSARVPGLWYGGQFLVDHGFGSFFEIGHACHLGGGLTGWIMGRWILRSRSTLKSLRRDRARREAVEVEKI